MARAMVTVLIILVGATAGTAGELGTISFPNTGAAAAQEAFIRGVLLLHSFEFGDAREAFLEAQEIDPGFVMAVWGEAMTHNHPLWREQDRDAARAALAKLGQTATERRAATSNESERGFLGAVEQLFGEGDKVARDHAYMKAMKALSERFPDDLEAKAFYALSILGSTQGTRDVTVYMRAGATAEEVYAAHREHPGALHYLIHSYDDPVHAPLGLRAARVYADVAPAASHAQHMISHIFVALGRWDESVQANVKSYRVSVERADAKELPVDARNFHALHWLEYSYLQLGQRERARRILDDMEEMARESGSAKALRYWAAQRATWLVDSGWSDSPPSLEPGNESFRAVVLDAFGTGLAALRKGDRYRADSSVAEIARTRKQAIASKLDGRADPFADVSEDDLVVAEVFEKELEAMMAMADGYPEGALRALDEATALEAARPLEYGPPSIPKPSFELYGETLLQLGRSDAAQEMFEAALKRAPRRSQSLRGLAESAHVAGDLAKAEVACADLVSILAAADESVVLPTACRDQPAQ